MWSSPVDLFYGQCVCKEGGGTGDVWSSPVDLFYGQCVYKEGWGWLTDVWNSPVDLFYNNNSDNFLSTSS